MSILPVMLCLVVAAAEQQAVAEKPARVLIVTGEDYPGHLWKETGPALRKLLEKDKRFEARIVEDAAFLASPAVEDYDVILLHFKNYKPISREAQVRENLAKLVKAGKGLVVLHFACGAFEDWPEFGQLAGMIYDAKLPPHDPRGQFTVNIVKPDHPITRGMTDFQTDDELYTCLKPMRDVEVLAAARSKVTGKDHPMAFVFAYGKGSVFHTPLGDNVRALEMSGPAELLRRGCLWAAGRAP
jgi:type 1 glutamine amidotransferase